MHLTNLKRNIVTRQFVFVEISHSVENFMALKIKI